VPLSISPLLVVLSGTGVAVAQLPPSSGAVVVVVLAVVVIVLAAVVVVLVTLGVNST